MTHRTALWAFLCALPLAAHAGLHHKYNPKPQNYPVPAGNVLWVATDGTTADKGATGSRDKPFTIRPCVHIQQETAHTTLELTCKDRHGLLSLVSRILLAHGVHISHAKISTFGEKAEDSFHLTDAAHRPLTDTATLAALKQALLDALQ